MHCGRRMSYVGSCYGCEQLTSFLLALHGSEGPLFLDLGDREYC